MLALLDGHAKVWCKSSPWRAAVLELELHCINGSDRGIVISSSFRQISVLSLIGHCISTGASWSEQSAFVQYNEGSLIYAFPSFWPVVPITILGTHSSFIARLVRLESEATLNYIRHFFPDWFERNWKYPNCCSIAEYYRNSNYAILKRR